MNRAMVAESIECRTLSSNVQRRVPRFFLGGLLTGLIRDRHTAHLEKVARFMHIYGSPVSLNRLRRKWKKISIPK